MERNGNDEDLREQFNREAADRREEAGGFGILLFEHMDLHLNVGDLRCNRHFGFLALRAERVPMIRHLLLNGEDLAV